MFNFICWINILYVLLTGASLFYFVIQFLRFYTKIIFKFATLNKLDYKNLIYTKLLQFIVPISNTHMHIVSLWLGFNS